MPSDASPRPPLIVVTGPTASGKSAFALALAEALGGEIVSADSMQVYRDLDIGTAKPTLAERARVPHHLVDVADPDEPYHAARFRAEAEAAVADVLRRGRVPLVVGGTALYLKVLLQGLSAGPGRDEAVRAELERRWDGGEARVLWEELGRADPAAASRLHPNDRTRVVRALEVWRAAGRPLSELHAEHRFAEAPYDALLLGMAVEREALYRRIDERVGQMLDAGWVDEVERLLARGYGPDLPPLQAIGYRQLCAWLRGGGHLGDVAEAIRRETRHFAKRQLTWFRRMEIAWLDPAAVEEGLRRARIHLQTGPSTL